MAKSDYGPEIRSSMAQQTNKILSGRKAGTTHTDASEEKGELAPDKETGPGETTPPARPKPSQTAGQKRVTGQPKQPVVNVRPGSATGAPSPSIAGMPPDAMHISHAAGIAHAILGNRRMM